MPPRAMSVDTLLMHPLMARPRLGRWRCNTRLPPSILAWEERRLGESEGAAMFMLEAWLQRRGARSVEWTRGLLDMRRRRVCRVDALCELAGRPAAVCIIPGRRRGLSVVQQGYMRLLRRVGAETYGADLRAVAIRLMPSGQMIAHEAP